MDDDKEKVDEVKEETEKCLKKLRDNNVFRGIVESSKSTKVLRVKWIDGSSCCMMECRLQLLDATVKCWKDFEFPGSELRIIRKTQSWTDVLGFELRPLVLLSLTLDNEEKDEDKYVIKDFKKGVDFVQLPMNIKVRAP